MFAVLAAAAGDGARVHPRPGVFEGHESARIRGKSIGGAAVTDDAMLAAALHLPSQEMSLRNIAAKLVIATGEEKASGHHTTAFMHAPRARREDRSGGHLRLRPEGARPGSSPARQQLSHCGPP